MNRKSGEGYGRTTATDQELQAREERTRGTAGMWRTMTRSWVNWLEGLLGWQLLKLECRGSKLERFKVEVGKQNAENWGCGGFAAIGNDHMEPSIHRGQVSWKRKLQGKEKPQGIGNIFCENAGLIKKYGSWVVRKGSDKWVVKLP